MLEKEYDTGKTIGRGGTKMNTAQGQWSNNSVRRTLAGRSTKVKKIEKKKRITG